MIHVVHGKDAELFTPDHHFGCQSRWYFKNGQPSLHLSVARSDFDANGWGDWHVHPEADQAYYILHGKVRVWMDEESNYKDIEAGDMVIFPMGRKHKLLNIGNSTLSALAINAPSI